MARTTRPESTAHPSKGRPDAGSVMGPDPVRNVALGVLVAIHVLGALGSPIAASLHLGQPGATDHQNFHVVWEAFKYFTASIFAIGLILGPLKEGRRWALWLMGGGSVALFGGVFISHAMTQGGPLIDFVAYGAFLVLSILSLGVLAARGPASQRV